MTEHQRLERLCVHTITTKPLSLEQCISIYPKHGIRHITIWRQALESQTQSLSQVKRQLDDAGLSVTSLCRSGFFCSTSKELRRQAIDDNLRAIEQAQAIGAPMIVLVCGADPQQPLLESRQQIQDAISEILPAARQANVKLAIEPLHPMYADNRSAINTIQQAQTLCDQLDSPPHLGIAVDLYHVWWDSELESQLKSAGKLNRLFALHICDWLTPTMDLLNDRGLMGEGCIPIAEISRWVDETGFAGPREVEIFSNRFWSMDQEQFLQQMTAAYQQIYES
jgi:sugar phosphate isomerase/epimerase